MDTLIFAGILCTLLAVIKDMPRPVVLGLWWVMLVAVIALLAHHITSSLSLGLSY